MGIGSSYGTSVHYQTIAPKSHNPGEYGWFVIGGVNRQIDWKNVQIGQIVHIALNEDVRPPSMRAPKTRLIAPYAKKVIVPTEICTTCAHDVDADDQNICPVCIETWCWDWFIRSERTWTNHGNYNSYSMFGCRCPECRIAHKRADLIRNGKIVPDDRILTVRGIKSYPSAYETDGGKVQIVRNEGN